MNLFKKVKDFLYSQPVYFGLLVTVGLSLISCVYIHFRDGNTTAAGAYLLSLVWFLMFVMQERIAVTFRGAWAEANTGWMNAIKGWGEAVALLEELRKKLEVTEDLLEEDQTTANRPRSARPRRTLS